MSSESKPLQVNDLLRDNAWLEKFSTYKQQRSILHQVTQHANLHPVKLIIETDSDQNFITIEYSSGEKITV